MKIRKKGKTKKVLCTEKLRGKLFFELNNDSKLGNFLITSQMA